MTRTLKKQASGYPCDDGLSRLVEVGTTFLNEGDSVPLVRVLLFHECFTSPVVTIGLQRTKESTVRAL